MKQFLFETPVFTAEAALLAASAGVDRLELCSSFAEGGETPGPGIFRYLKQRAGIPVFVMIRPRGGDFAYSAEEIEIMGEEIRQFCSLGADGFVFGILNADSSVNAYACKDLVIAAENKPCTFHRAFDVCNNRDESLETIISCGFKRILTSGGKNSVDEGLHDIIRLMNIAKDRIIIMPGGGLKPGHIETLRETGYLKEMHASCKKIRPTVSRYRNQSVQFSANGTGEDGVLTFDVEVFRKFKAVIG